MTATSGPTSPKALAYYDPDSSSWKTSQATFLSEAQPSLATLPASGMTHDGWLYALPTSEPAISAPDSSSSQPTLPTPTASQPGGTAEAHLERKRRIGRTNPTITDLAMVLDKLLPTPKAHDSKGQNGTNRNEIDLSTALSRLHEPPTQTEPEPTEPTEPTEPAAPTSEPQFPLLATPRVAADRSSRSSMTKNGHWSAPSLAQAIELAQGILPREFETWAEVPGWHGGLTNRPSDATPTPSEDQPPPPQDAARRLDPPFVEWMMMLPEGHVTDPDNWQGKPLTRNQQLHLLGNGVVPPQAAAAIDILTR